MLFGILGPAVNSSKSIFLYGHPGNGKTAIAEAVSQMMGGTLYVPYAVEVEGQIMLVHDPVLFLVVTAVNGFFTVGQFSWMPMYLPELFPTGVRGSAISLVFDITRYVAALGPLLAGWLIATLGGSISSAASIIGVIYVVGLIATPFAGPETKGTPLPE